MNRFLIEVSHAAEESACHQAVKILQDTGSHYLTNADFGCMDEVHKAWIIVETETKEQARNILPSIYRQDALVVSLNKFTPENAEKLTEQHGS